MDELVLDGEYIMTIDLRECRDHFIAKLAEFGIDEKGGLTVAKVRKSHPDRVGYYSHLSQFRSERARIVVDVAKIQEAVPSYLQRDEVLKTIAHEYGHVIAEAIRELPRISGGRQQFNLPMWQDEFDDEERFAEDLADFLVTYESIMESFWSEFLPAYGRECTRLFATPELEPTLIERARNVGESIQSAWTTLTTYAPTQWTDSLDFLRTQILTNQQPCQIADTQIDILLNDDNADIRALVAARNDLALTDAQAKKLLHDSSWRVRQAIYGRLDIRLTTVQIEQGLTDPDPDVRVTCAGRSDYLPTEAQIERGLLDAFGRVRNAFSARRDIALTETQIERGRYEFKEDFQWHLTRLEAARLTERVGENRTPSKRVLAP